MLNCCCWFGQVRVLGVMVKLCINFLLMLCIIVMAFALAIYGLIHKIHGTGTPDYPYSADTAPHPNFGNVLLLLVRGLVSALGPGLSVSIALHSP